MIQWCRINFHVSRKFHELSIFLASSSARLSAYQHVAASKPVSTPRKTWHICQIWWHLLCSPLLPSRENNKGTNRKGVQTKSRSIITRATEDSNWSLRANSCPLLQNRELLSQSLELQWWSCFDCDCQYESISCESNYMQLVITAIILDSVCLPLHGSPTAQRAVWPPEVAATALSVCQAWSAKYPLRGRSDAHSQHEKTEVVTAWRNGQVSDLETMRTWKERRLLGSQEILINIY